MSLDASEYTETLNHLIRGLERTCNYKAAVKWKLLEKLTTDM